jgi:hypothetical protein
VNVWIEIKHGQLLATLPNIEAALAWMSGYVQDALGVPIQPAAQQPAAEEVLATEVHTLGGAAAAAEFTLRLTRPAGIGVA